jgi:hypothetical protein
MFPERARGKEKSGKADRFLHRLLLLLVIVIESGSITSKSTRGSPAEIGDHSIDLGKVVHDSIRLMGG